MRTLGKLCASALVISTLVGADGCVTTDVSTAALPPGSSTSSGSLSVSIHETPRAASRKQAISRIGVDSRLVRVERHRATTLQQYSDPEWRVDDLAAGRYRVEILGPEVGSSAERGVRARESFTLKPGRHVKMQVILKDHRGFAWAGVGAAIAGVVIAAVVVTLTRAVSIGKSDRFVVSDYRAVPHDVLAVPAAAPLR